jgi:LysM repeat protein
VIVVTDDDPDFQFPDDTPPVTEPNPPVVEVPVDTEPAPPIVEEPIVDDENAAINITSPASSENTAGTDIPEPESPITGDHTPPVTEPNPPVLEVPVGIGPISPVLIPEIDLPSTVTLEPSGVISNPLPSSVIDPPTDGSVNIGRISAERVGILNSRVTDLNGPSLTAEELADIKYIKSYLIHETWSVSLGTKLELQEGDTLSSLAKEFGVSESVALDVLRGYNPQIVDVSQVKAGDQIYLPSDVLAALPNTSPVFDRIIDPKTDGSEAIGNLSPDRVAELNARLDEIDGPPLTPKELAEIHHISRHLNHDRSNRWAAETGAKLTIEPGYNLEFLAQEFGVSQEVALQAVLDYNPHLSGLDQIKVGDSINIPLASASNLPEASIIRGDVDSILDRVDWAQAEISSWAEDAGYRIEDSLYQVTGAFLSGVGSVQRSDFVQSLGIADIKKVSVDFSDQYFKLSTGGLSIEESQNLYLQQTGNEISRETIEILFTDPVKSREILMNDPEIHKQYRDILNNDLPRNINEAINNSDEWKQLLPGKAVFHGSLTRGNQKFISQDGYREVIFNPEGNLVSHNVS